MSVGLVIKELEQEVGAKQVEQSEKQLGTVKSWK